MKIVVGGSRSSIYGGRFSGAVELEMLSEAASDDQPDVARVHFAAGAATNWHRHPGGQLLFVLDGSAYVGTGPDGAIALEPGTLVVSPAGERHWHGAAAHGPCTFLVVTWGATSWEDAPAPPRDAAAASAQ